jgi:succinate dehydrogenase / fumarate reductase membrane anchor subunit
MSLRSPLGKALGMGAAKEGAAHWWAERISSAGLVLLAPWFLFSLISLGDLSYANVVAWVAAPLNTVLLSLFLLTATYHAQLGLQVIIQDYVAAKGTRLLITTVINFGLLLLGLLGVFSVLRIAFAAAV